MDKNFPQAKTDKTLAPRLRGVYPITPDEADTSRLLARVAPLLGAGIALLQYRNKLADAALKREQAMALLRLCDAHRVALVINDDARLAREIGAAGAHLGENDGDVAAARELLGDRAILGVSCYDEIERARRAVAAGASYVAFGAFHPTATKNTTRRADTALLRDSEAFGVPRCCIGGITPHNARPLVAAGAELIAVIGGVFNAADPLAALEQYEAAFADANGENT
ncbi:MAG: thiamine phosphate synthase [Myxococcales bacterium]